MALPISYNVRNLRVRWQVTLLAIIGIALVVGVFVVLGAMPMMASSVTCQRTRRLRTL